MSLTATAIRLRPGVSIPAFIKAADKEVQGFIQTQSVEEFLNSRSIEAYYNARDNLAPDVTFTDYILAGGGGDAYPRALTASFAFQDNPEGTYVLVHMGKRGGTLRDYLLQNENLSDFIAGNYSAYDGSDSQVVSGELSLDEWRDRLNFWRGTEPQYWPSYKLDTPFSAASLVRAAIAVAKEDPRWSIAAQKKRIAQQLALDHALAERRAARKKSGEGDGSDHWRVFQDINEIVDAQSGDEWKQFIDKVGELNPLS